MMVMSKMFTLELDFSLEFIHIKMFGSQHEKYV